jgi:dihydrodipicolinate synthase/N-acetylneuraminate lyase
MSDTAGTRKTIMSRLFPEGVPRLWCPLLTHYDGAGRIDLPRMSAHLAHISRWVKGYLVPGTTGDGWELGDAEEEELLRFAAAEAQKRGLALLAGVLKPDAAAMVRQIDRIIAIARSITGKETTAECLAAAGIVAFTVCPPKGRGLTQEDITAGLSAVLGGGLPTALYQLPQVTENEVSPAVFGALVKKYPNLIFFKDTSGNDRVALSDAEKGGVFLTRGAEGNYAGWLKEGGGPYDGFLLSTANCFADRLAGIIEDAARGDLRAAGEASDRVSAAFGRVFDIVQQMPQGNAFTNANKAIDHFFAFGPSAHAKEGPMLHAGARIPQDVLAATGDILAELGLMPRKGYLAGRPFG